MKFRLKAFATHLLVSLLVAMGSVYLVFQVWHPSPLQQAVGVTSIFLLLLTVDVVSGPLLTLIVASSAQKKTLKFDMAVIIACQLAAYIYGMHSIAVSRPVYVAFDVLRFEVVQADSVVRDESKAILPEFAQNPWFKFRWVAIQPFKDAKEQSERTFYELQTGISPTMQAHLYQPIEQAWPAIEAKKHHLDELQKYNSPEAVKQVLYQYPQADSYLPLKAPVQDMTVLLDSHQRKIIKIVDLHPFK